MSNRPLTLVALCLVSACVGQPDAGSPAADGSAPSAEAPADASTIGSFVGSFERLTPEFDELVPGDARIEVLAEGHGWTEGPVWVGALGGLLYSDIPANSIFLYREGRGSEPWLAPAEMDPRGSGASNGLILGIDGGLLLAQHGDRRIARLEAGWEAQGSVAPDSRFATLASGTDGGRFNSPNDLAQGPGGDIYFTDPPYGLAGGDDDPSKELTVNGVYRLRPDGGVEVIDATLSRPNGIVLSPDARTLYVASSSEDEQMVVAYPVEPDGSVGERRHFADSWGDGMTVDQAGNVYVAEPMRGVYVFDPSGRHLGSILTGQRTSNVAWGDDGSTLYITADSYLMRIRLSAVGVR
jgi:gluconolactonase